MELKDAELQQALICVHIQAQAFFLTNDGSALAYQRSVTTWVPLMSCICFVLSTSSSPQYELIMNTTNEGVYGICLICTYVGLIN